MAADCKSAALRSYGGSNPPLCTSNLNSVNRLAIAFAVYAVLGVLAWSTLSDSKIRMATLALLALFAVKTLLHRKDVMHVSDEQDR